MSELHKLQWWPKTNSRRDSSVTAATMSTRKWPHEKRFFFFFMENKSYEEWIRNKKDRTDWTNSLPFCLVFYVRKKWEAEAGDTGCGGAIGVVELWVVPAHERVAPKSYLHSITLKWCRWPQTDNQSCHIHMVCHSTGCNKFPNSLNT